jgi:hypothetical protein
MILRNSFETKRLFRWGATLFRAEPELGQLFKKSGFNDWREDQS